MPSDKAYMERALALAAQGRGRTSPNPMVGCVVVSDNAVVGEGYHEYAGGATRRNQRLPRHRAAPTQAHDGLRHPRTLRPPRQDPPRVSISSSRKTSSVS